MHVGHSGVLLAGAGAFALLALTARGTLGVVRVCGPRLHAVLDVTVAIALAAAPALPALRPDVSGIVVVEVAAVAWLRLATLTRYRRPAPAEPPAAGSRGAGSGTGGPAASAGHDAPGSAHTGAPGSAGADAPGPGRGAVVARGLGVAAGRSARRLPEPREALADGARRAGRSAARLQRAWARGRGAAPPPGDPHP